MSNSAVPAGEAWKIVGNNIELPNTTTAKGVCRSGGTNVLSDFSREFGCSEPDPTKWKAMSKIFSKKFRTARKCLTRRISEMGKYNGGTSAERDQRKRHIYPIKTAYTLGRNCLRKFTTRKNAVRNFTKSVNTRLARLGKPNILSNSVYGLAPTIAQHIKERQLKAIYNNNYGFADANAWSREFNSRVEAVPATGRNASNSSNSNSSNSSNSNSNSNTVVTNKEKPRMGGGQAASVGGGSATATATATTNAGIKEDDLLSAHMEKEENDMLHKRLGQLGLILHYRPLLHSLPLFNLELKIINGALLKDHPAKQKTFEKLMDENTNLQNSQYEIDKITKSSDPKLMEKFFLNYEKHDRNISEFLKELGICPTEEDRIARQDAILNDVEKRAETVNKLFISFLLKIETFKTTKKDDCYRKLKILTDNFNAKHLSKYNELNDESFKTLRMLRPPKAEAKDTSINTFPEFLSFMTEYNDIIKKK